MSARSCLILLCTTLAIGCSRDSRDILTLEELPDTKSISRYSRNAPITRYLIQIDDWHLVPQDALNVDDAVYAKHLDTVSAVQFEQVAVLRHILMKFDVHRVYLERFADDDIETLAAMLIAAKHREADRETILNLGPAGKLWVDGELGNVLPAESRAGLDAGKKDPNSDIRHRAIVDKLGNATVTVIVLGAGHDLRPQIPEGVEYIRVRTNLVAALMGEDEGLEISVDDTVSDIGP